jgi:hypothetical protein
MNPEIEITSPVPNPVLLSAEQFNEINNRFASQDQQINLLNQLLLTGLGDGSKSAKFELPPKYDGSLENYDSFVADVLAILEEKSSAYKSDTSKILFVSSLLTGKAKTWVTAKRQLAKTSSVPCLKDFLLFMNEFESFFMNRSRRELVLDELNNLKQGRTPMHEHLANLEALLIQGGFVPESNNGLQFLVNSLNSEFKLALRNAKLYRSDLEDSYQNTKTFLIQLYSNETLAKLDARRVVTPLSSPNGPIPMDLSEMTSSHNLMIEIENDDPVVAFSGWSKPIEKIKWTKLPPKEWVGVRDALLSAKCCLKCHQRCENGHPMWSVCELRDKKFNELPFNKASFSSYSLCFSSSTFLFPIFLNSHRVHALIDTGAMGFGYISMEAVKKFKFKINRAPDIQIRTFEGKIGDTSNYITESLPVKIHDCSFNVKFRVLKNLCQEVILGFEFFRSNGIKLDCKNNALSIDNSSNSNTTPLNSPKSMVTDRSTILKEKSEKAIIAVSMSSLPSLKQFSKSNGCPIYSTWVPTNDDVTSFLASAEISHNSNNNTLPTFLHSYKDVFDLSQLEKLPEYKEDFAMPIDIKTGSRLPTAVPYKLSLKEELALKAAIDEGLSSGKLELSSIAGGCPVLFVKKPDGSLRMCIDYRKLNEITESIQAILPNIDDLLCSIPVSSSPLFSKLDMKSAFGQLRIRKGDEPKTAFVTKFGKYQSKVIQFGVKNAPGHFQMIMNKLFSHLFGKGVYVYIDDILIAEPDPKKHRALLLQMLDILKKHNFVLNESKCLFEVDSVDFLGYHLSSLGVTMQHDKIAAVKNFPKPKCVKDLQRFLGLTNYYKEFVKQYSDIASPLFKLLQKDSKFVWTKQAEDAWVELKSHFTPEAILIFPDRSKPFILYTDCSKVALGAVLHQFDEGGQERAVSFFSRTLTSAEKNYPIYDKEMLAIKASFAHWRHLLIQTEHPVTVYCDHKNLTYFKNPHLLNERQSRWHEFLADFNFIIHYLPGHKNVVADALSRPSEDEIGQEKTSVLLSPDRFGHEDILGLIRSPNQYQSETSEKTNNDNDHEYYTPKDLVELATRVAHVDIFDLDPASCHVANSKTNIAKRYYTKRSNGLQRKWFGNIFLNPPYTSPQGNSNVWIHKAYDEYQAGRIKSITMLLRDASGSPYFNFVQEKFALCYLKDRIKFWNLQENCKTFARDKHVIAYLGPNTSSFEFITRSYGFVSMPTSPSLVVSPINNASPIPVVELEQQIQDKSTDELFELTFLKDIFQENSPELQAQQQPETTTVQNWPVFMFYALKNYPLPESLPIKFKKLVQMNKKFCLIKHNRLFRKIQYLDNEYEVPYVPVISRKEKLKSIHDALGHLSNDAILDSLRTRFWWPQQLKDLKDYQETCEVCQLHRRNLNSTAPNPNVAIPPCRHPILQMGARLHTRLARNRKW